MHCEPSRKSKKEPPADFTARDLESVVLTVDRYYIDKNIDKERAYTDAAVFAMMALPKGLYLYPREYYKQREQYEDKEDILPGKTFQLSPSDEFLVFEPDYVELEKRRKKKLDEKPKKNSKKDLEDLVKKEQTRKDFLASKWKETKFGKKDFERVISFIKNNLTKYNQSPFKEEEQEKDEDDEDNHEFTMRDVYLAAANGYLNSLDPHSNVFLKKAWEESMAKITDSSFEGIGAILSGGGNRDVVVENPLEGRPAVKAGLRAGDIIVAVNSKRTKGLSLEKVVKYIKGKKGTIVTLTIKRTGSDKYFDIKVKRDKIEIRNVSSRLIKGNENIAYIKLTGFVKSPTESSDTEIIKHFRKLKRLARKKNVKLDALILDLRGNAGGYLDLAIDIADMFVTEGLIVSTKSPNRSPEESYARKKDLTDLPLAVLINAKSASASEIVASAIKFHGRGILLGERTFGKATVQKLMDLPGNGAYVLKLTQARYYSPSGRTIQVVGVEPDIPVSNELDGSFPFQYREENMWHHLPKVPSDTIQVKKHYDVEKIRSWVEKNGKAEKFLEKHKNDPIKPDIQLVRSIDYINGMLSTPRK
ncbi:MAG: S41 family peptidase [Leptospiraceae bacterium]|nr:S41 family peptidase [Leptospiraceae bacterium]